MEIKNGMCMKVAVININLALAFMEDMHSIRYA
jgi:hypothetical protein